MITSFQYAQNIKVAIGDEHVFNTEADWKQFEAKVLRTLLEIMKYNWTGYGVIQGIREIGKPIFITPTRAQGNTCAEDYRTTPGWNGGIRVAIAPSFMDGVNKGPGSSPDEVLLHELIHAFSIISGSYQRGTMLMQQFDYHTIEEFMAIVLTNIYISAKKGTQSLRKDHRGFTALSSSLIDNEKFLLFKNNDRNPYPHLSNIKELTERGEKAKLCRQFVRHDGGAFNPVNFYLNHKQRLDSLFQPMDAPDLDPALQKLLRDSEKALQNR